MADRKFWLLKWVLTYVGLAAIGWLAARLVDPDALLIGPSLLVSPLIAWALGTWVFVWLTKFKPWPDKYEAPDAEMDSIAARFGSLSGLQEFKMQVDPDSYAWAVDATFGSRGSITIRREVWILLAAEEREYAMARAFALAAQERRSNLFGTHAWGFLIFVGCVASALNPWLVIVSHASYGVLFAIEASVMMKSDNVHIERMALGWTRNFHAALSYLDKAGLNVKSGHRGPSRLDELRTAAGELGLI